MSQHGVLPSRMTL
jgi:V-type H+-transporting ATPase subunit D